MPGFLKTIGWISIIGGFIAGIMAGFLAEDGSFRFTVTLSVWIGGLASGVVYIALAMILEQQEEMSRTIYAVLRNVREDSPLRNSILAKADDYKMKSFDG